MYLAPRQGKFALVIAVSFCLHIIFFVISAKQSLQAHHDAVAKTLLQQVTVDMAVPLLVNDRVSLAVLGERVVNDPSVAYLAVFDANDQLVVPIGDDVAGDGMYLNVADGDKALGKVLIKTTPISRAKLMGEYWLFMAAALLLHGLLWTIYGYLARPTARLQQQIADAVRDRLVAAQYIPATMQSTPPPLAPTNYEQPTKDETERTASTTVGDFLRNLTKSDFGKNRMRDEMQADDKAEVEGNTKLGNEAAEDDQDKPAKGAKPPAKVMVLQVAFVDKHHLLEMMMVERKEAYFALCNQLIEKMLTTIVREPLFAGVNIKAQKLFDESGMSLRLERTTDEAELALASAVLLKLIISTNQVVYAKHRELNYFALPMKAIASDEVRHFAGQKLLAKYPEALILMSGTDAKEVATQMNLSPLASPLGIHERECRRLTQVSDEMAETLGRLRHAVLSLNLSQQS